MKKLHDRHTMPGGGAGFEPASPSRLFADKAPPLFNAAVKYGTTTGEHRLDVLVQETQMTKRGAHGEGGLFRSNRGTPRESWVARIYLEDGFDNAVSAATGRSSVSTWFGNSATFKSPS